MKNDINDAGSTTVRGQVGAKPASGQSDAQKREMQQKMEAAGKPGPGHKALEALAGNWKAEVKCWSEPGGQPHVSQGTAKATWLLNGRFLEEEFHGEMMGKPFTGRTLLGYDNTKQTFNTVWISDMQTAIFVSEGKGESDNKVITLEGKSNCAASGQKDMSIKSVYRVLSPDKHIFEMFNGSQAENAKTLEITYTRQ